jgi:uncharacterized protein with HEPN domain
MRTDQMLLQDILDAIDERILCTPSTREEFDADKFLRSHLLRQIQIIGEAAWRLSNTIKDQHPHVPWRQIAGMRHALVHDYFEVDWNEVYQTAIRDIPALRGSVDGILAAIPSEAP